MRFGYIFLVGLSVLLGGLNAFGQFEILGSNITSFEAYNNESSIVLSGEEGVITCWRSARKGMPYNNLYLQKIDRFGRPVWELDGTPVSPYPANQTNFSMVSDGFGGVVIVWEDGRKGNDNPKIFAQRINLRGEPLWGLDGLQICDNGGAQRNPKLISDRKNGFYVVWQDSRKGHNETDLFAQHINLSGRLNWMAEGLPIVTHPNQQKNVTLATDEKHYLYVMWEDFRNGLYWNLYGQKLDRQGNFFWKPGGMDVFAGVEENHQNPSIVPDGYGGLIFVYQKYSRESRGYDVYRGRMNTEGEIVYHFSTCSSQADQINPKISKRGAEVIICWEDKRHGQWDIYAQSVRVKDGIFEWSLNGVPVCRTDGDDQLPFLISSTVYNYQIFAWLKTKENEQRLFVQKLDNLGNTAWGDSGREVCPFSSQQSAPSLIDDMHGGLWVSWTDDRIPRSTRIFTQHVESDGKLEFSPKGIDLHPEHKSEYGEIKNLKVLPADDGQYFLAWEDYRNGYNNPDIYIQKFTIKGEPSWRRSGIPVCIAAGEQSRPFLVTDGDGGVIVVWVDKRNNLDDNIYAQRINSNGKMLWNYNGLPVCVAPQYQGQIRAIPDGKNGVIICWGDARTFMSTGFDLYIQRISALGEPLWETNGKPFARDKNLQTSPSITPDGEAGAFICWADNRDGHSNIFVQHINQFGIYQWGAGGRSLYTNDKHQRQPMVLQNFENDVFLAWEDARHGEGNEKIYMQLMTGNGSKIWGGNGQTACYRWGRQTKPVILTDDFGSLWVTWLDERAKSTGGVKLIAQQFDLGGNPKWPEDGITLGSDLQENNDYEASLNKRGYAYYTWNQTNSNGTHSVYYQKLSPEGTAKYGVFGYRLGGSDEDQLSPVLAVSTEGRALVCYIQRNVDTEEFKIFAVPVRE